MAFSNSTEKIICIVIKLPGMDNTVSNDDCAFQGIKAKYLEVECHKLLFCGKHGYSRSHSIQSIEVLGPPEMPDGICRAFKHLNYLIESFLNI